jgi:AraC-like DNA-binding protein
MSSCRILHYADLLEQTQANPASCTESNDGFVGFNYDNASWGKVSERRMVHQDYTISHIKTDLHDNYKIAFENERLHDSVNICISVDGYTGVQFDKWNFEAVLHPRKQHSLYINETEYHVLIKKKMDNVHFSIDRQYYLSLLCEKEKWSNRLRQQLSEKQFVYDGDFEFTPAMQRVISDILHSPLMGSLKSMMTEAKILELIALQLQSSVNQSPVQENKTRKEQDLFYAIRDHLDSTFMEDHSLKGLGRTFGVNEFKLKSGFKSNFGKTVFEHIYNLRMEYAYQLLRDNGLIVNEVSRKVGYKNPNHFSTAFKKKFGITPGKI